MRALESSFNRRLRTRIEAVSELRFYRIESHSTVPGIPDNHYINARNSASGWTEVKEETVFPSAITFRPAQAPWLMEYARFGGRCYVVLFVSSAETVVVIPGRYAGDAARNLRATPRWEFRLSSATIWMEIGKLLSGKPGTEPPGERIDGIFRPSPEPGLTGATPEGRGGRVG